MRAARMYGYNQPLVLEDVPIPNIKPDEVLLKVSAAGMCRTDVQLVDGYFQKYSQYSFPLTPGHEIVGEVQNIGSMVPKAAGLQEGDSGLDVALVPKDTDLCLARRTEIADPLRVRLHPACGRGYQVSVAMFEVTDRDRARCSCLTSRPAPTPARWP